ncbi:MAG: hypothetical protein NC238_02055 [Dehalobacter sp.]|nr:hypothetical protein [Dehalobacter sp.]
MTIKELVSARRIIPRWRLFKLISKNGELLPSIPKEYKIDFSDLNSKVHEWEKKQDISSAIELVEASLVNSMPNFGIDAANMLLLEEINIKNDVVSMANRLVGLVEEKPIDYSLYLNAVNRPMNIYKHVNDLKKILRFNPDNPIAWMDLSYFYTLLAQTDKAVDSMRNALALTDSNRVIIRAASRLFVHIGEPDRAKFILSGEETRRDPWLLSAEIAVSQVLDERSKNIKFGRTLSESRKFSPLHISELASALATVEFFEKNFHQSKKLIKLSLKEPTENSIAQAIWLFPDFINNQERKEPLIDVPKAYEARTLDLTKLMKWEEAIAATKDWLMDEPFSSRPAVFGSYIAAIGLEDFSLSAEFANKGLRANPNDLLLKNNLAFALANQDLVEEANEVLASIDSTGESLNVQITLQATRGLINLRSNNLGEGKRLYEKAIDLAKKNNLIDIMASASINYARELVLSRQITASQARAMIEDQTKRTTNPHIIFMKMRLEGLLEKYPD